MRVWENLDRESVTESEKRIDRAFGALDRDGILARQGLGTASGSAMTLLDDELAYARQRGESPRGFVIYSRADLDRARQTGELMLGFGACADNQAEAIEKGKWIGREIVVALRKEGLVASWAGTAWDEIFVQGLVIGPH